MRTCSTQSGFSFIEMVISMAVVVVLASLMLGSTDASARRRKLANCLDKMQKLQLSMALHAKEHDGAFPSIESATKSGDALKLLVPTYTTDESLLTCEGGGYSYAMGLKSGDVGMLVADRLEFTKSRTLVFPEAGNHRGKCGNILFADGHAEQFATKAPRNLRVPLHATLLNP